MNFLEETKEAIQQSGHNCKDVMFVGSKDGEFRLSWNNFTNKANFEYDNGYGSREIASDLIVYFQDKSYLDRREYDGSEWWEYNKVLDYKKSDTSKSIDYLKSRYGSSVADSNSHKGE